MGRDIAFDMVPDISLMEKIGATSFTLAEAIVELVANSIDAKVPGTTLEVDVQVTPDQVSIVDNGTGMTADVLREAVRLGVNMDEFVVRDGRKGMYGLGMKTACASLGQVWSVTTRAKGSDEELHVEFDLEEIRKRSRTAKPWHHSMTAAKHNKAGVLGSRPHGTAVVVKRLRDQNPMKGPVLDALGRAYRPHLEAGEIIRINGDAAPKPTYQLIEKSRFEIDEKCGEGDRWPITGWAGLDSKTHNDGFYGLNLYRKGQLIASWNKEFFRAHLMTSRIVGELNLDFVPVNFHKKGFETQSVEWKTAQAHMRAYLKDLVKMSETASQGRKDTMKFTRAVQGIQKAYGAAGDVGALLGGEDMGGKAANRGASVLEGDAPKPNLGADEKSIRVDATTIVLSDGPVRVTHKVEQIEGEEDLPWEYIYDPDAREIQAIINSESKLFKSMTDSQFLGILALSESVTQFLVEEKQMPVAMARRIRNRWLSAALGRR